MIWRIKRLTASVWADLVLWTVWILILIFTIVLPIYLGAHYLGSRRCYPHLNLDLSPELIKSFLPDPKLDSDAIFFYDPDPVEEDLLTGLLVSVYPPEVGVRLIGTNMSHRVARLPRPLYRRGTLVVSKEMADYSLRSVSQLCEINTIRERGLLSLGLAVCWEALGRGSGGVDLKDWLGSLELGVEDDLVGLVLKGDLENVITLLTKLFPKAGLNASHIESMQHLIRPFQPAELTGLMTAFRAANLTEKDLAVLGSVMEEAKESISDVNRVLAKINPENLVPITQTLNQLGIKLSDFISNPGLILEFFGDPDKIPLLQTLQILLPRFRPTDIEAFLTLSKELEKAQLTHGDPNAEPLMTKLFSIALDVLLGALSKLKIGDEAKFGLHAIQLLFEDDSFKKLLAAVDELQLLDPAGQKQLLQRCTEQHFKIRCKDVKDRCPNGQVALGVACLLPLVFPGLVYSISTILHYRGSIVQCGIGKPFNLPKTKIAWIVILPIYLLFMIPWTLCLIIYRQCKVWVGLAEEARGQGTPLEPDCPHISNASSFGLLLGAGQGILHLGVQAVILGLVLLAGDVFLGLDKDFYLSSTLVVTCVSLVLVGLTLGVSHLSSQEACRLSVDLATPPRSKVYLLSSLAWLVIKVVVTVASTLILALLIYIDTVGFSKWRWSAVSLILLLPLPLIQCILYQACVRTGAEHRFVWGLFASIIPVRFLDMERRRARLFLLLSQSAWTVSHVAAWILYAIFMLVEEDNDVIFRLWIPVVIPVIFIPPLISFLHWSSSLSHLYSAKHAHPDMESETKRQRSFPPDWKDRSGSNLTPDSLAQVGFFYSCRRLKSGEATCFSCGRQVVEWTSRTALEAHKSVTDSCPLYAEVKYSHQMSEESVMSSSCLPEFTFLSVSLLSRLASLAIFLWVFMDAWILLYHIIPTIVIIPILFLVVSWLVNPAVYYSCVLEDSSLLWSLTSPLAPQPSTSIQFIVLNLSLNALLHALMWGAMLGTSPLVVVLAWARLAVVWPALLALAILSALSALPHWYLSLRPARERHEAARRNSKCSRKQEGETGEYSN